MTLCPSGAPCLYSCEFECIDAHFATATKIMRRRFLEAKWALEFTELAELKRLREEVV